MIKHPLEIFFSQFGENLSPSSPCSPIIHIFPVQHVIQIFKGVLVVKSMQLPSPNTLCQVAENPPLKEQVSPFELPMPLLAFSQGSIHIRQDDCSYRVVLCCLLVLIPFEQSMCECYDSGIDAQTWAMREDHCSQKRYRKC